MLGTRLAAFFIFLAALFAAAAAPAQVCPPSNAVGHGFSDGCSVPSGAPYVFPGVGAYEGTFTPACQRHDKCYSSIGSSYSECNGNFLNDMKGACRNAFDPILAAPIYLDCMANAQLYYNAVDLYLNNHDPLPDAQGDHYSYGALTRSRDMEAHINGTSPYTSSSICGTTVAATTLFDQVLVDQVNNTWQQYAHRQPTIYEFFAVVDARAPSPNIVYDRTNWNNYLVQRAIAAAPLFPPAATYVRVGDNKSSTLAVSPVDAAATYQWSVNNIKGTSTTFTLPTRTSKWDSGWWMDGYLIATKNGQKNMGMVHDLVYVQGWCAPQPIQNCN